MSEQRPVWLTNSRVDRAGQTLRGWLREVLAAGSSDEAQAVAEKGLEPSARTEALGILLAFRTLFLEPLRTVEERVQGLVDEVSPADRVTGRPKRTPAILIKLTRHPTLRLSQMEDIGGCRAKLPGLVEVRRAQALLMAAYPEARIDDYIAKPKPTGYRAVHVVVLESGRRIEVQLRTRRQNEWADAVESAAGRLRYPLKDGEGPDDLLHYFEAAARMLAAQDEGLELDDDFQRDFKALREKARPFFKRG